MSLKGTYLLDQIREHNSFFIYVKNQEQELYYWNKQVYVQWSTLRNHVWKILSYLQQGQKNIK